MLKMARVCATLLTAVAAVVTFGCSPATARAFEQFFPGVQFKDPKVQQLANSFDYQRGKVSLGVGGVELEIPPQFYFLAKDDARRVLVDLWDNPPIAAEGVLGMILPADKAPVEDTWGALITFAADGYVSDAGAAKIDYARLLASMQRTTAAISADRVRNGFGAMRLIGWASPPRYDSRSRSMHWAKELQFNDAAKHTLNYDVRALGRHGVLKLNVVASLDQLASIEPMMPALLAMPRFVAGARYQDFVAGADKVAPYNIGGLITGIEREERGIGRGLLTALTRMWGSIAVLFVVVIVHFRRARNGTVAFSGRS